MANTGKTWDFIGTLQENGVRVVSKAEVKVDTVPSDQKASAEVVSEDGIAKFQFKIPQGERGPQGPAATLNLSIDGNTLLFS